VSVFSRDLSLEVIDRLRTAGCVAAEEEADELLSTVPDLATLEEWVARREQGEPLEWVVGRVSFCGQTLHISPGVFVPRPQSEELARRAARLLPAGGSAADLCTGCGAIAAHLGAAVLGAKVVGTELHPDAAACAGRNAVAVVLCDLGSALRAGRFDVVTAVSPYVPTGSLQFLPGDVQRYEPRLALDGGADGLTVVQRVIEESRRLLRGGGWLLCEIGGGQAPAVEGLLERAGFERPQFWRDDDGDLRGFASQRPSATG